MSSVEAAAMTGVRSCRSVDQILTGRVCSVGLAMKIASTTSSQRGEEGEDGGAEDAVADGGHGDAQPRLPGARPAQDRRILDRAVKAFQRIADRDDREERQRDQEMGDDESERGAA